MKIFVVPSWYPPPDGHFFQLQASALAKKGHSVVVLAAAPVSMKQPLKWLCSWVRMFGAGVMAKEGNLTVVRGLFPTTPGVLSWRARLYAGTVLRLYRRASRECGKPDIIHAHSLIWGGYGASAINDKYGIPYVITEHRGRFIDNEYVAPRLARAMNSPYVKRGIAQAAKVFAVSSAMLPYMKHLYQADDTKFGVIENMVDVDGFQLPPKTAPKNEFRFFSLARLVKLKGFDDLITAFARVADKHSHAKLFIGGDGPERETLKKLIHRLSLQDNVVLLGKLNHKQVADNMQAADAFVLASRYEAFGVVLIEAMACGLPIVATRAGGPDEIVSNEVGLLSDVADVSALADNMLRLVETGATGFDRRIIRDTAVAKYSETAVADKLIATFENILQHNAAEPQETMRNRGVQ